MRATSILFLFAIAAAQAPRGARLQDGESRPASARRPAERGPLQLAFASGPLHARDLWLFDVAEQKLTKLTDGGFDCFEIAWPGDGSNIMFTSRRGGASPGGTDGEGLYSVGGAQSRPARILDKPIGHSRAAGGAGAIVYESQGAIFLLSKNGGALRRIAEGASPEASQDGSRILFQSAGALWSLETGSGKKTKIDQSEVFAGYCWSPDGERVYYSKKVADGNWNIFAAAAAGGDNTKITEGITDTNPKCSPDGRTLAYVALRPGAGRAAHRDLILREIDSGLEQTFAAETLIKTSAAPEGIAVEDAKWSPDSEWLAVTATPNNCVPGSKLQLVVVHARTRRKIMVAGGDGAVAHSPAWRPAGN